MSVDNGGLFSEWGLGVASRIVDSVVLVMVVGGLLMMVGGVVLMGYDLANPVSEGGYEVDVVEVGVSEVEGEYVPFGELSDVEQEVVVGVVDEYGGRELGVDEGVVFDSEGEYTVIGEEVGSGVDDGVVVRVVGVEDEHRWPDSVIVLFFGGLVMVFAGAFWGDVRDVS